MASPIIKCPMFSSSMPEIFIIFFTFSKVKPCPALTLILLFKAILTIFLIFLIEYHFFYFEYLHNFLYVSLLPLPQVFLHFQYLQQQDQ